MTTDTENSIRIHIDSAEGLAEAVRHQDVQQRAKVLQTIRRSPAIALGFGPAADGRDIVETLLALCEECRETFDRLDYVYTALSLGDDRVLELARNEFLQSKDTRIIAMAAKRLAILPCHERIELLEQVVLTHDGSVRPRVAANLLAECVDIGPRVAIRAAMVADVPVQAPPLAGDTLEPWLAELQGPYPKAARAMVDSMGADGAATLLQHWDSLPEALQPWALRLAVQHGAPERHHIVREVVRRREPPAVLIAALEYLQEIPGRDGDAELITPLHSHEDAAVRAAAIATGHGDRDWRELLQHEPDPLVREAVAVRLERSPSKESIALLVELLHDANWRVRARAVQSMIALAPVSTPALRKALSSSVDTVRTAAAKALHELGEDDMLRQQPAS